MAGVRCILKVELVDAKELLVDHIWLVQPTSKKTPVTSTECCKLERMPRPAVELGMSDTKDFERH